MQYANHYDFFRLNDIKDSEILLDENSITKFYCFCDTYCDTYFVKPTKKWVNMWWNYDTPDLFRFEPNIEGTTNGWGLNILCWQSKLVETSWKADYIADDITLDEINTFCKDYKYTRIYESMMRTYNKNQVTEEHKEKIINQVKSIEDTINKVIKENKKNVLINTATSFNGKFSKDELESQSVEQLKSLLTNLEPRVLDCGFLYFRASSKKVVDLFKEVAEYDSHYMKNGSIHIDTPWYGQSTTLKRHLGEAVKRLVKEKLNMDIEYWTVLD